MMYSMLKSQHLNVVETGVKQSSQPRLVLGMVKPNPQCLPRRLLTETLRSSVLGVFQQLFQANELADLMLERK